MEQHRKPRRHHRPGDYHRASAQRVFATLIDPQQRMQWWGAEGLYRATHMES
jgi:uncharacterized protein YndB with AHSA1/START domain